MDEGHGLNGSQRGKGSAKIAEVHVLQGDVNSSGNLIHGHSRYREDLVKFGGQNDWGDAIKNVLN